MNAPDLDAVKVTANGGARHSTATVIAFSAGLGAVLPLATDIYLIVMPSIARDLGASLAATQRTMAVFALGLLPFSIYQLQSRAFYARGDTKTPALVQVLVSTILVLVDVAASVTLPAHTRIYGLAAGLVIANWVGAVATTTLLLRQLGSSRTTRIEADGGTAHSTVGALGRMTAAGLAGAVTAAGAAAALTPHLPRDWTGAAIVVTLASMADVVIYGAVLLILGVDEAKWPWLPHRATK